MPKSSQQISQPVRELQYQRTHYFPKQFPPSLDSYDNQNFIYMEVETSLPVTSTQWFWFPCRYPQKPILFPLPHQSPQDN